MPIEPIEVKEGDVVRVLENQAYKLAFVNSSIMAMCERKYADMGSDELLGLQSVLFEIEGAIRGVEKTLSEAKASSKKPVRHP